MNGWISKHYETEQQVGLTTARNHKMKTGEKYTFPLGNKTVR